MDNKQKQLAQEWFDAAESDYQYAQIGLNEDNVFPQVAFLSQQVGEKVLKGFLVLHKVEPSRTHDLTKLLDECIKNDILPTLSLRFRWGILRYFEKRMSSRPQFIPTFQVGNS